MSRRQIGWILILSSVAIVTLEVVHNPWNLFWLIWPALATYWCYYTATHKVYRQKLNANLVAALYIVVILMDIVEIWHVLGKLIAFIALILIVVAMLSRWMKKL